MGLTPEVKAPNALPFVGELTRTNGSCQVRMACPCYCDTKSPLGQPNEDSAYVSGGPVDIEVGLAANLWIRCAPSLIFPGVCSSWSGSGVTDFSHTAVLTGIDVFDSSGAPIGTFDISSASGPKTHSAVARGTGQVVLNS